MIEEVLFWVFVIAVGSFTLGYQFGRKSLEGA
jgi:hypothetical protein